MTHGAQIDLQPWQERGMHIMDEIRSSAPFEVIDADEPWGALSLDATERRMLESWSSAESIPEEIRSQFELFLGEGLKRCFGGEWTALRPELLGNASTDQPVGWGILYPTTGAIDVVSSLVPLAYRAGTGTWWSSSFEATRQLSSGS